MSVEVKYFVTKKQQYLFENFTAKYNIVRKGRRFGFTHGMIIFCFEKLLEKKTQILWGDTINSNIDRYFSRYMLPLLNQLPEKSWLWNAQKKELKIINRQCSNINSSNVSLMDFRSADIPENWEGFGYNYIVLNEAGIILKNPYLFKNAVLPMLLDYSDSKLIAGGVPKGKTLKDGSEHPFYTLSKRSKTDSSNYLEFVFTSYDSAVADKKDIDNLVQTLGGANNPIARQEIFAEFIDAVDMPFLYNFDIHTHVGKATMKDYLPLYLSWDFNVKTTCLVIQYDEEGIYVLKEYHERGIDIICEKIKQEFGVTIKLEFGGTIFYINGDASGNNDNAANVTNYELIKKNLDISFSQFRVPKANMKHKGSYFLCNYIFANKRVIIDESCTGLIRDCSLVQIKQMGDKIEIDKSDQTLTHHLDPLRYHIHAEHLSAYELSNKSVGIIT